MSPRKPLLREASGVGCALRWMLAVVCTLWSLRAFWAGPQLPADEPGSAPPAMRRDPGDGPVLDAGPRLVGAGAVGPGRGAASDPVQQEVSPRLQAEIVFLRTALAESLEGQRPLRADHAGYLATWVMNLMLDAAYQDALDLGRGIDPDRARAQVFQVLEGQR